ncbi:MAG: carboxypeptidase regulatory-like domain-containing protein [Rhodocyclales bacterium]|nr:carboxypeptidase regulatory-like domain-containing protein [Rhodocyclales bacterium]
MAWALLVLLLIICGTAQPAPLRTPEVERGLAWLEARVNVDGSVQGEDSAMAQALQVRCEVYIAFFDLGGNPKPACTAAASLNFTELLARSNSVLPAGYWLNSGGVAPGPDYAMPSPVDMIWVVANRFDLYDAQKRAVAVDYLLALQQPSGALLPPNSTDGRAFSALAGAALASRWEDLSPTQRQKTVQVAQWLNAQAIAPGDWGNVYLTALAHLFLANVDPDPARDVAVENRLVGAQRPDGSWAADPFLTALAVRALSLRSVPTPTYGTITLRAIDAKTRLPLTGVSTGGGEVSDAQGNITMNRTPDVVHTSTLTKTGYQGRVINYRPQRGVVTDLGDIEIEPLADSAVVSGTVTDAVTGAPIPRAWVRTASYSVNLQTDADGRYLAHVQHAGWLELYVEIAGYRSVTATVDVRVGESYRVDVALQPVATDAYISGVVTDAVTKHPLQYATLTWQASNSTGVTASATTDADGRYTLGPLAAQAGTLTVLHSGHTGVHSSGLVPAVPMQEANIELQPAQVAPTSGTISGTVRDHDTDQPVADAEVVLTNYNTGVEVARVVGDAQGSFSFTGLPFVPYRVSLRVSGYQSVEAVAYLWSSVPNATVSARLKRLVVSGRVVDALDQHPIEGALIELGGQEVRSDADGRFSIESVKAGVQPVTISAPGYRTRTHTVTIAALGDQDFGDIALEAAVAEADLAGFVTDSTTGDPIAGATITTDTQQMGSSRADGSWLLTSVVKGRRFVRVSQPGYQSQTREIEVSENKRYNVSFALERAESGSVDLTVLPDRASYTAYAPIEITTAIHYQGKAQVGLLLDVALVAPDGRMVAYENANNGNHLNIAPGRTDQLVVLNTSNLAPGTYTVESRAYDNNAGSPNSGRAVLAKSSASVEIVATRRLVSVEPTALPVYVNYQAREAAGARLRVVNESNVTVSPGFAVTLTKPSGGVVATYSRIVELSPDQHYRDIDLPLGSVLFDVAGQWPISATVVGVPVDAPPGASAITVLPGYRIEAEKHIAPEVIAPDPTRRIRIDLQIKGVRQ